jgi:hypothetical protein
MSLLSLLRFLSCKAVSNLLLAAKGALPAELSVVIETLRPTPFNAVNMLSTNT